MNLLLYQRLILYPQEDIVQVLFAVFHQAEMLISHQSAYLFRIYQIQLISHVITPSVSMGIYFIVRSKAEHYFIFHCNAQT